MIGLITLYVAVSMLCVLLCMKCIDVGIVEREYIKVIIALSFIPVTNVLLCVIAAINLININK
jgi:hypothetical protein